MFVKNLYILMILSFVLIILYNSIKFIDIYKFISRLLTTEIKIHAIKNINTVKFFIFKRIVLHCTWTYAYGNGFLSRQNGKTLERY